jgi:hypothetical protein
MRPEYAVARCAVRTASHASQMTRRRLILMTVRFDGTEMSPAAEHLLNVLANLCKLPCTEPSGQGSTSCPTGPGL